MKKTLTIIIICILVIPLLIGCKSQTAEVVQNGEPTYNNGEVCGAPGTKY